MIDAVSRARLTMVLPALADKINTLADSLAQEGITIRVVQAWRSIPEQDQLYKQGRTTPGRIVTNAQGGHSWHNFGCAVDCAVMNPDGSVDWNAAHPAWRRMEALGTSLGLTSGANWVRLADAPHFQLTGRFPEAGPDDEVRQIYLNEGMEALWQEVSKSWT